LLDGIRFASKVDGLTCEVIRLELVVVGVNVLKGIDDGGEQDVDQRQVRDLKQRRQDGCVSAVAGGRSTAGPGWPAAAAVPGTDNDEDVEVQYVCLRFLLHTEQSLDVRKRLIFRAKQF